MARFAFRAPSLRPPSFRAPSFHVPILSNPALLLAVALVIVAPIHVSSSPHSPHVARCSPIWQTRGRPCSWFEGWYVRVVDPSTGGSYAAIIGSMPIANRSIAMLLSCHPKTGSRNAEKGEGETADGGRDEGEMLVEGGRRSCQVGEGRRVMREDGEGEREHGAGACGVGASGEGPLEYVMGHDAAGEAEAQAFEAAAAAAGGSAGGALGMGACEVTLIEKMEIAVSERNSKRLKN
ncbi:unnamed protein product [Closterium sp. Yama58-4]|nr:unnamed protein product [Closterium sp. Yama58-4]